MSENNEAVEAVDTGSTEESTPNVQTEQSTQERVEQREPAPKKPRRPRPTWRQSMASVSGFPAFLLVIATAIVSGFVDPEFGWNMMSLRLVLVFLVVFLVLNYTGAIVKWVAAKRPGARPRLMARPIYLVLLVITIVFARGTGIDPALVFGTVIAIDYATQSGDSTGISQRRGAISAIAGAAWAFLLGLAGWVAYTYIAGHPFLNLVEWDQILAERAVLLDESVGLAYIVAIELTFTLAIAALGSMPLMLLPLRMFDGGAIWAWKRSVWGVVYVVALTMYSLVLLPLPGSWEALDGTVIAWFVVFGIYAAVALAIWLTLELIARREKSATKHVDETVGEVNIESEPETDSVPETTP